MWGDPYQYSTGMLVWILLVASICRNDAHKEVRGIAGEATEELKKQNAGVRRLFGNRGLSLIMPGGECEVIYAGSVAPPK